MSQIQFWVLISSNDNFKGAKWLTENDENTQSEWGKFGKQGKRN